MSTSSTSPARRPLKSRDSGLARGLAARLAAHRVAPNQISLASLVFALLGAGAMLVAIAATGGPRTTLFIAAAICIQLRLLCNLLDGMVAVEGGMQSPTGAVFNEVPDRFADLLLIVPAGYACGLSAGPELGWLAGCLALLTAYLRSFGASLGLPQDFRGPMAKPHRMAAMTLGLLLAALLTPWGLDGPVLLLTLILIVLGTGVTVWLRARAILGALSSR